MHIKNLIVIVVLVFYTKSTIAQNLNNTLQESLSFKEYLSYVKKHHPLVKQAHLKLSISEANLLKSRGGFDPKIEVDYDRKSFKNTTYYNQLNATFKIPTWYGVEFKANFEENSGVYLNPNLTVPDKGIYSAGVSFSLAQGLLINKRMAMLKKAKNFVKQNNAQRKLEVNNLINEASIAYFKWAEAYNELAIYNRFLSNVKIRFNGVKRYVEVGEKAAVDSVEAKIALQNRTLNLEAAKLKTKKAMLKASNYLWLNNIPLEIQNHITPLLPDIITRSDSLAIDTFSSKESLLKRHPKLNVLKAKIQDLDIDRALKKNKLLPKIDLQYNFLTPDSNQFYNFNAANYKTFVNFSFPLFLRKERGDLKLTKLKLEESNFEFMSASLAIFNKIEAIKAEINSLKKQHTLIKTMASNYKLLLYAEERKFKLGESSLFLINSREQKLIATELKANTIKTKLLNANTNLNNALGFSNNENLLIQ